MTHPFKGTRGAERRGSCGWPRPSSSGWLEGPLPRHPGDLVRPADGGPGPARPDAPAEPAVGRRARRRRGARTSSPQGRRSAAPRQGSTARRGTHISSGVRDPCMQISRLSPGSPSRVAERPLATMATSPRRDRHRSSSGPPYQPAASISSTVHTQAVVCRTTHGRRSASSSVAAGSGVQPSEPGLAAHEGGLVEDLCLGACRALAPDVDLAVVGGDDQRSAGGEPVGPWRRRSRPRRPARRRSGRRGRSRGRSCPGRRSTHRRARGQRLRAPGRPRRRSPRPQQPPGQSRPPRRWASVKPEPANSRLG